MISQVSQKNLIREKNLMIRESMKAGYAESAGQLICACLNEQAPELLKSDFIAAFYPSKGEPDLIPFFEECLRLGKRMLFPRHVKNDIYEMAFAADFAKDFKMGKYRIPEPKEECKTVPADILRKSAWIVPGVAFDRKGGRIGHGRGVFDRLLSNAEGIKIGVCFEKHLTESVPMSPRDISMDFIVTEKGIRRCGK